MPEEIVVTKIFSNEIGAAMVQEVNWINRSTNLRPAP